MKKIFSILAIAMMLASCHSQKAVVNTTSTTAPSSVTSAATATGTTSKTTATQAPKVTHATQIANSYGTWQWAKVEGSLSVYGGMSLTASMQMRMEHGKSIYISIRPLGLIEVARLIITGDTLIMIDKYHKRYLCESVKLITNGIPADVTTVQDLFLGRPFILGKGSYSSSMTGDVNLANVDGTFVMTPKNQDNKYIYDFKFDSTHKILSVEVKAAGASNSSIYAVNYTDVKKTVAGNVPGKVSIETKFKDEDFGLKLEYKTFTWNQEQTIDTTIPKNYKRMSGESLMKMLGGE